MKVLVCGGRDFCDDELMNDTLNEVHGTGRSITAIIQGGASGADFLAAMWATDHNVLCIGVPADWANYGKAAGPIRNRQMLEDCQPDLVLAFPGGRGTADMVRQAKKAGIKVQHAIRERESD